MQRFSKSFFVQVPGSCHSSEDSSPSPAAAVPALFSVLADELQAAKQQLRDLHRAPRNGAWAFQIYVPNLCPD